MKIRRFWSSATAGQLLVIFEQYSSSFSNLAAFDTPGANLHSLSATMRHCDSDGLKVWIKAARRAVIGVGNIIAELRAFATNLATFGH